MRLRKDGRWVFSKGDMDHIFNICKRRKEIQYQLREQLERKVNIYDKREWGESRRGHKWHTSQLFWQKPYLMEESAASLASLGGKREDTNGLRQVQAVGGREVRSHLLALFVNEGRGSTICGRYVSVDYTGV